MESPDLHCYEKVHELSSSNAKRSRKDRGPRTCGWHYCQFGGLMGFLENVTICKMGLK